MILSPASLSLGWSVGSAGELLRQQVSEQADDAKKKREREAKFSGYSSAGRALIDFGLMSAPGAL